MNTKECFLVANKNVKANKFTSFNIIFSFVISIISIVLCLFIYSVFSIGIKNQINDNKNISTLKIEYMDYSKHDYSSGNPGTNSIEYREKILLNNGINENISFVRKQISFDYYSIGSGLMSKSIYSYPTIIINGNEIINDYENHRVNHGYDMFDVYSDNSSLYLKSENDYLNKLGFGNVILAGTDDVKNNEIIISSAFLDYYNINYNDVIGKNISYKLKIYTKRKVSLITDKTNYINENYKDVERYLFKDFIIKGVYNSKIYNCRSRERLYEINGDHTTTPLFWIKESQLYKEKYVEYDSDNKVYYYNDLPENIFDDALSKNKICLFEGFNNSVVKTDIITDIYQFNNIDSIYDFYCNQDDYTSFEYVLKLNHSLKGYIDLYPYFKLSKKILLIVSIIISFISIVNIFISFKYLLIKKIKFSSMCNILGMTKKDISKMYTFMNLINYIIAIIISFVISFTACLFTSIICNNRYNSSRYNYPSERIKIFDMNVLWLYIPIFVIIILVFAVIVVTMSSLLTKKIKDDNLLQLINE